jgi:hypothetical protein
VELELGVPVHFRDIDTLNDLADVTAPSLSSPTTS